MEPKTIVIQSIHSHKQLQLGELALALNLPATYRFSERTCVRIHSATGFKEPVHIFGSFAEQVPFGETFRRHLALITPGGLSLPGPWTRVEGNFVSNLSVFWIARLDGEPITKVPRDNFTLVIEFRPEDGGAGDHFGGR